MLPFILTVHLHFVCCNRHGGFVQDKPDPADQASSRMPSAVVTGVTFDIDRTPTFADVVRRVRKAWATR